MVFQSLVVILPPYFDFKRPQLSPWPKINKFQARFVAGIMMNKCAKCHGDSQGGKKVKFNLTSAIELSETAVLCTTTLYRNPIQASNFGGTFDQLFL